jgi:vacuolar protein sorting-associated protein 11
VPVYTPNRTAVGTSASPAMLTWKRFSFFDKEILPAPEVKGLDITCSAAGHGCVFLGDAEGGITTMSNNFVERKVSFSTFRAYDQRVTHLQVLQKRNLLISLGDGVDHRPAEDRAAARKFIQLHRDQQGEGSEGQSLTGSNERRSLLPPKAVLKFWQIDTKMQSENGLRCVHQLQLFVPPLQEETVTKLAMLEDCTQIAVGLNDGRVMLIQGQNLARPGEPRRHVFPGLSLGQITDPITTLFYTTKQAKYSTRQGYRGSDVMRNDREVDASSQIKSNVEKSNASTPSVVFKPTLFVGTVNGMRSYPDITSSERFNYQSCKGVDFPDAGMGENCCTPTDEGYAAVGQEDGVFFYDAEDRLDCYVCKGKKTFLSWFKGFLVMVLDDDVRGLQRISVCDLVNKYSAFSMTLRTGDNSGNHSESGQSDADRTNPMFGADVQRASSNAHLLNVDGRVTHVLSQWGQLIFLTSAMKIYLLNEKGLEDKLDQLFGKHLYQTALKIVDSSSVHSNNRTYRIHKMYAEHLFNQGEYDKAVDQYIKTIGGTVVQPSDVIRLFLGAKHPRRIMNLTRYLEALHKDADGGVTSVHTTLLIKCFTKHQDQDNIREFLKTKFGENFDAESTVRVLRGAGYLEEAAELAQRYDLCNLYLRILLDDVKDCSRGLAYIEKLPFLDAELALKSNGKFLLQILPDETTELIKTMCTVPRETFVMGESRGILHSKPEDFLFIYVDHPLHLKRLLWHCVHAGLEDVHGASGSPNRGQPVRTSHGAGKPVRSKNKLVWNTLIELCLREDVAQQDMILHSASRASPSGPYGNSMEEIPVGRGRSESVSTTKELIERETMALLESEEPYYDSDHAIVLVQQYRFTSGLLHLYEKHKMYHMLLQYYMDTGNNRQVLIACRRYGKRDKNLWAQVLSYFCHAPETQENVKLIRQVLKYIEDESILTPLTVLQIASKNPNLPLAVIRDYIINHLDSEAREAKKDRDDIDNLRAQILTIKEDNEKLKSHVKVFPNTKCDFTGHPLELPVIHFMSGFSYNLENVPDSGPDGTRECPNTAQESRRILEMHRTFDFKARKHEDFFRELNFATKDGGEGFDKVAEYFGQNVFSGRHGGSEKPNADDNRKKRSQ